MQIFAQFTKADEGQRLVYGRIAEERPDRSNEIFDYNSSKPFFLARSEAMQKTSGGKNLFPIRAMHKDGTNASGHAVEMNFDDANKTIDVVAKITDDQDWRKVQEGTYTGFSIEGRYVRKAMDSRMPQFKRYTADPKAIALADVPCMPGAVFQLQKADGTAVDIEARGVMQPEHIDLRDLVEQTWTCQTVGHEHMEKTDAIKCVEETLAKGGGDKLEKIGRILSSKNGDAVAKAREAVKVALQNLEQVLSAAGFDEDVAEEESVTKTDESTGDGEDASKGEIMDAEMKKTLDDGFADLKKSFSTQAEETKKATDELKKTFEESKKESDEKIAKMEETLDTVVEAVAKIMSMPVGDDVVLKEVSRDADNVRKTDEDKVKKFETPEAEGRDLIRQSLRKPLSFGR